MYEPGQSISNKIAWATQMDKPTQMDILFAICRVLNLYGRSICICRDQLGKFGTRIRYQNFYVIAWVLYFDFWAIFGFNIIQLYCNCKMWFFKA